MSGKAFPVSFVMSLSDMASSDFAKSVEKMRKKAASIGKIKDPGEQARARMAAQGERLTALGKSMTVGLTLPIVGFGTAAVLSATQFEQSMANISTVIDSNTESIDAMSTEVLNMGKRLPVPLAQLSSALYDIRSAGIAASDQFSVLEGSAKLAVAGLGTTEEATDMVTSALNAFRLSGKEAESVYNSIYATVQYGKTNISGLAQGFGSVAATVASSGTKLDEYLSMVAALTTTGQPASEAHTQLKAVLSGLTRTSKETSAVFRQLGAKDLPTLIQQSGGLMPALESITRATSMGPKFTQAIHKAGAKDFPDLVKKSGSVEAALGKLGPAGQANASKLLKLVGSTEALNAIISLTGPVADTQQTALDGMRESSDLLDKAFDKQSETSHARFQKAKNAFESAAILIGERLLPHVTKLAEALANAADGFDKLSGTKQSLILWGAAVMGVMGPVLGALGNALTIMNTLKAGGAMGGAGAAGVAGGVGVGALAAGGALAVAGGVLAYNVMTNDPTEGTYGGANGYRWDPTAKGAGERLHDAMTNMDRAKIEQALLGGTPWSSQGGGAPWAPSETVIKVDFKNLPPGARVASESEGPASVDLNLGYSMPPGG